MVQGIATRALKQREVKITILSTNLFFLDLDFIKFNIDFIRYTNLIMGIY